MHCVVATILSSGDPCCGVQNSTGGPKIAQQPREDGERGPARRRTCRTAEAATPAHHRHINTRGGSALRQLVHEPDKMKQGRKLTNLNDTHGKEKGSRSASGRLTSPHRSTLCLTTQVLPRSHLLTRVCSTSRESRDRTLSPRRCSVHYEARHGVVLLSAADCCPDMRMSLL